MQRGPHAPGDNQAILMLTEPIPLSLLGTRSQEAGPGSWLSPPGWWTEGGNETGASEETPGQVTRRQPSVPTGFNLCLSLHYANPDFLCYKIGEGGQVSGSD